VIEIPLSTGDVALIDDCDAELLQYNWWRNSQGYLVARSHNYWMPRLIRLHRAVMERITGKPLPAHLDVDHIDGNRLDCRRGNLRVATRAENSRNRDAGPGRRYKGVYRSQTPQPRWVAKIQVDGQQLYLGSFSAPEAAARAYNRACLEHHGDFARLNHVRNTP
jgi:hypothetical protein